MKVILKFCLLVAFIDSIYGQDLCPIPDFYPMPGCTGFYRCANGIYTTVDCPAGLLFDVTLTNCNWAHNVICLNPSTTTTTTTTASTSIASTTTAMSTTTTTTPSPSGAANPNEFKNTTMSSKTNATTTNSIFMDPTDLDKILNFKENLEKAMQHMQNMLQPFKRLNATKVALPEMEEQASTSVPTEKTVLKSKLVRLEEKKIEIQDKFKRKIEQMQTNFDDKLAKKFEEKKKQLEPAVGGGGGNSTTEFFNNI